MLGVAALIIVMSVMNGFRAELFDKIVGLNGRVVVCGYGVPLPDGRDIVKEAKATPGSKSATPLIEQPLLANYNGRVEAILVRGMTVPDIRANPILNGKLTGGDLKQLTPGSSKVAIGIRLAENLGAQVGSRISIRNPDDRPTPFGTVPRAISYTISAIFAAGA